MTTVLEVARAALIEVGRDPGELGIDMNDGRVCFPQYDEQAARAVLLGEIAVNGPNFLVTCEKCWNLRLEGYCTPAWKLLGNEMLECS